MNLRLILLIVCSCFLTACGTVSPDIPIPEVASANHSGIYAHDFNPDGSLRYQWWYEYKRETYNGLISLYGTNFVPAISADDSLVKDGIYWKANFKARKQFDEMEAMKLPNFNKSFLLR